MTLERSPDVHANAPDMPAAVVEAFTAATITAFEELTQLFISAGQPFMAGGDPVGFGVIAVIKLRKVTPGRLTLAFPQVVLAAIARRYLPADIELSQEIIEDTAGEFANVIAGQAKTALKGSPYHFGLSTPVVSHGSSDHRSIHGIPSFARAFSTEVGTFVLCVQLSPGDD